MAETVAAGRGTRAPGASARRVEADAGAVRRQVRGALEHWTRELRDLDLGNRVERVASPPSPLAFLRDSVGPNRPLVMGGVTSSWRARRLWSDAYLCEALGERQLTVALTPDGRADAVREVEVAEGGEAVAEGGEAVAEGGQVIAEEGQVIAEESQLVTEGSEGSEGATGSRGTVGEVCVARSAVGFRSGLRSPGFRVQPVFMLPFESKMTIRELFDALDAAWEHETGRERTGGAFGGRRGTAPSRPAPLVPYFQAQDSSLTSETPALLLDVPPEGPAFAREAFGAPPEAVNVWIGNGASYTSWHKDPFENVYCVMRGTKVFYLLPPCDAWRMRVKEVPVGRWRDGGERGEGKAGARKVGAEMSGAGKAGADPKPLRRPPSPQSPLPQSIAPTSGDAACDAGGQLDRCEGPFEGLPRKAPAAAPLKGPLEPARADNAIPRRLVPVLDSPRATVRWATCPEAERGGELPAPSSSSPPLPAPMCVRVGPGETLYLPAHWWHAVGQDASDDVTHRVIAVNYWYEARMGSVWAGAECVDLLARVVEGEEGELGDAAAEDAEDASQDNDGGDVNDGGADNAYGAEDGGSADSDGESRNDGGSGDENVSGSRSSNSQRDEAPAPPPPPSSTSSDDLDTEGGGGWWDWSGSAGGKRDGEKDDGEKDEDEKKEEEEEGKEGEREAHEKTDGGWWDWSGKASQGGAEA